MRDVGISRGNGVRGLLPVSRQTITYPPKRLKKLVFIEYLRG
jgi:hypothetical protein